MMIDVHRAKARFIGRTLGIRVAAGYLRNRGYSPECAIYWLLGS